MGRRGFFTEPALVIRKDKPILIPWCIESQPPNIRWGWAKVAAEKFQRIVCGVWVALVVHQSHVVAGARRFEPVDLGDALCDSHGVGLDQRDGLADVGHRLAKRLPEFCELNLCVGVAGIFDRQHLAGGRYNAHEHGLHARVNRPQHLIAVG